MNNEEINNIKKYNQKQKQQYEEAYEACRKKCEQLTVLSDKISLLRSITFAIAGLLFFFGYQQKNIAFWILAFGSLCAFVLFIRYHSKLVEELEYCKDSQSVCKDYLARFDDSWKLFSLDGARYLSDDFLEARDLDLFGKSSLYQYICTASTTWGQDQLAIWLRLPDKDFASDSALQFFRKVKSRQQAAAELSQKPAFCMALETSARRLRTIEYDCSRKMTDNFFHTLEKRNTFPAFCKIPLRLFPLLTLILLFFTLLGISRHLTAPLFFLCAFAQLMSAFVGFYWTNQALSPIYQMNQTITPYRKLFQLLEKESFESAYLKDLQKTLLQNGTASIALKELEKIADCVRTRHNIYAFLLYNSLFLYDYQCLARYLKWKDTYRDSLKPWLEALGKAEALISLAVISHTRTTHCLPEIVDSNCPVLSVSAIYHPLLNESAAVGNDISLTHHICILTGSNMSGKTTFMRSIGVNLVLAYAGGFCTASSMQLSLMNLCTSIRTEDNVNEGISTFYAELLRIKEMIAVSKKQVPMLCLIDEIYKGTNSKDRIFAAKETIRNLSKPYAFTLVTTHDFELCDLEHDIDIDAANYYFTEHYEENKILFDYKLRSGRCTTTNAQYLLRMAGILS